MYDPNRVPLPPDMMGITSMAQSAPMPDLQRGQMTQAPPSLGYGGQRQLGGFAGFGGMDGRAIAEAIKGWVQSRPEDPRSPEFDAWRSQMPGMGSFMPQQPVAPSPVTQLPQAPAPGVPQSHVAYPAPPPQRNPVAAQQPYGAPQNYGQYLPQQAQKYMPQGFGQQPRPPMGTPRPAASGGFFGTRKGR